MFSRQLFEINTDTGSQVITGSSFFGAIMQARWVPTTGDTGADLNLTLLPNDSDTGDGWQFAIYSNLGSQFTKSPTQPMHLSDGDAAGSDPDTQPGVPIVSAGDKIKVEVVPGGAAVAGRLYVWTGE